MQVNGKVRDRFEVETGLPEAELVERALQSDKVRAHVDGKQVRQTIVVPDKLVNVRRCWLVLQHCSLGPARPAARQSG